MGTIFLVGLDLYGWGEGVQGVSVRGCAGCICEVGVCRVYL